MQKASAILHNGKVLRGMEHLPDRNQCPAVILLHGFTGTKLEPHRFFLKMSKELERYGIAVFRFDFLGSGESDGDFEEMTVLNELAEAKSILKYVLEHPTVDSDRVSILGFSMGGLVASLLAGEMPETVEKLVLLAPAGNMEDKAESIVEHACFIEEKNAFDLGGNLIGRNFIDELKTIKVYERAANYGKDVLLVHGTEDLSVPFEESMEYIEESYGERARLVSIHGADHTFNSYHWEKQVIEAVCAFLTERE